MEIYKREVENLNKDFERKTKELSSKMMPMDEFILELRKLQDENAEKRKVLTEECDARMMKKLEQQQQRMINSFGQKLLGAGISKDRIPF